MPRANRSGAPFQVYLQPEQRAALEALADTFKRSLQAEIAHAIERHLANPPTINVPALKASSEPAAKKPKKKRGG